MADVDDAIKFYVPNAPYGAFSNFAARPILVGNVEWPTSEHYFQAQKFMPNWELVNRVRRAPSPRESKRLGSSRSLPLRADWEEVKESVMLTALRAKFTQHDDLRELLLSTGRSRLVEHTWRDSYWGDGGDGTGLNRLGVLLMQVRDELSRSAS